jgi:cytoskeletal protein CcmA (bactofilin family)
MFFGKSGDKKGGKPGKQIWNAFFANSVEIEGSLRFSGLLNIDGHLTGAIVAKGMLVTGSQARIVGDIFVENLMLSGTVIGNIFATGEVHLNHTANVTGNINYNTLSIVPGAVHEGNSHLFSEKERLTLMDKIQAELSPADDLDASLAEKPPVEVEAVPPPRKNLEQLASQREDQERLELTPLKESAS